MAIQARSRLDMMTKQRPMEAIAMGTLLGIKVVNIKGSVEAVVNHNHHGSIRDRGECPACDEFYGLYCEDQAA